MNSSSKPLLVVGAGIAGVTAALEAAEAGSDVVLVERDSSIGGRVTMNHHYFPKLCPPTCGMEVNIQRIEANPRLRVIAGTTVTAATQADGGWQVTLGSAPKFVNDRCTACGDCAKECPAKVADPYNLEMTEVSAIRLAQPDAWPRIFTLDRAACPEGCTKCVEACKYEAINLTAEASEETLEVSAVVIATGWKPYALENLKELGGGELKDVIANVQMERMVSPHGPTEGKIKRPSDGEAPKKVAFVQCAGSRDVNHLAYCSSICCLASLKQAIYVKEQLPEAEVTVHFIDKRTPGRNEDMLDRVAAMEGIELVKGKIGSVEQDGGQLKLKSENVETGQLTETSADMVVLATGMVPNVSEANLPFDLELDDDGFGIDDLSRGIIVAGVTRRPEDVASSVRDATGAAAKSFVAGRSA